MANLSLEALPHDRDTKHAGRVDVTGERFSIGRDADNDWVLEDPRRVVSKRHAVIERHGAAMRLTDRSTNGVRVNGEALGRGQPRELRDGDEIELGGYRFRARVGTPNGAAGPADQSERAITSILHDLAPAGGMASTAAVAGNAPDVAEANPIGARGAGASRVAVPLGWDGPPDASGPDLGARTTGWSTSRELTDRSEQAGPDRRLIELPTPRPAVSEPEPAPVPAPAAAAPLLPPDWMDEPGSAGVPDAANDSPGVSIIPSPAAPPTSSSMAPARPTPDVLPVTNLDVDAPSADDLLASAAPLPPAADPFPATTTDAVVRDLLAAFAEGLGTPAPELSVAEARRLVRNAGRALAISGAAAREGQVARVQAFARLEVPAAERTPWINAIGARDGADVPRALLQTLIECEPHELEGLRADFGTANAALDDVSEAALAAVGEADEALNPAKLRRRAGFFARLRPGGRAAAAWRTLRREGRVLDASGRPRLRALLRDALSTRLGRGGA